MTKLYEKNEMNFALVWIGLYVVLMSVADSLSESVGMAKCVTAPLAVVMTLVIFFWIRKNGLMEKFGLCKPEKGAKEYLYYIPLVLIASTNVWFGLRLNLSVPETVFYVISMFGVGFLEEIIFRGFLFKAMCESNVKTAIIVSSITFGLGHIVNLLNGAELASTIMQVCYAIAIGFAFTLLFYKGKSLWPCIVTHMAINSLSVFANREARTLSLAIVSAVFLIVVSLGYAAYLLYPFSVNGQKKVSSRSNQEGTN